MHLWLLRHAKSSWDDSEIEDRDRPLAPRGGRAADRIRDYLVAAGIRPALVLCSSALRARETLARVLPAVEPEPDVRIESSLYTFDAAPLLHRLGEIPDGIASVMLVGHNPAIQELAVMLAARGDRLDQLAQKYPTAALAEIEFPAGSWHDIGKMPGELTRFVVPRELGQH
ncbi:MAG: histidine phosphatase family protein [Actinomycetota bacterium]